MKQNLATPSEPQAERHAGGINCPTCRMFVPVSISRLLYDKEITCPHCGLTISIGKQQSAKTSDARRKVEEAAREAKEKESFKR